MSRTWWRWARLLGGAAILAVLVRRLGAGPFLDAAGLIDGWTLAAASAIAVLTTVCCAWRWSLVARGLGLDVPLPAAIAAYYRSQFLNSTLPGGVLGDVHRGVSHGRDVGEVGRSLRAVAWERSAGQVVQVVLTVLVLLVLPSPVRSSVPAVALLATAAVVAAALLVRMLAGRGTSRTARAMRTVVADVRDGVLARRALPGILLASAVVVAGHTATFVIAARAAGVTVSTARLLPLALLVLLAMSVPTNIGGWGPREGAAAWAFAAAGLGAAQGVTTAVVYGVLAFVACLPGAGVLVAAEWSRRSAAPRPRWSVPAAATAEGAANG